MTGNSKINSYKRIMMALEGKRPDRIPVFPLVRDWAIRQAGFTLYTLKWLFHTCYCTSGKY